MSDRPVTTRLKVQWTTNEMVSYGVTVMPKRLLWVDGFLCLAVLAVAVVLLVDRLAPRPGVTPENFRRLRHEMTEREAVAILGRLPDNRNGHRDFHLAKWDGEDCSITLGVTEFIWPKIGPQEPWVSYGEMILADGTTAKLPEEPSKSPLDKFREWIGLK